MPTYAGPTKANKKVRKVKRSTAPPRTDVQSSGGNYGFPKAKKYKKTKPYKKAIAKTYSEQGVVQRKKIRENAAPPIRKVVKKTERKIEKKTAKKFGGGDFGPRRGQRKPPPKVSGLNPKVKQAGFVPDALINKKARKTLGKIGENAAREIVDIPANIIPTISYLGDPLVKGIAASRKGKPEAGVKGAVESGKRFGEAVISLPKEFAKDPGGTFVKYPVSTTLMFSPAGKVPTRTVKAVKRRVSGKERTPDVVELPGTRLKENRQTTTGYARNIKKRTKRGKPSPTVTAKEIETRIDEDVALMEGLTRRESSKAAKKIYKQRKKEHVATGLPKKEARKKAGAEAAETAQVLETKIRAEQTQKMIDTMGLSEKPKVKMTSSGPQLVSTGGERAKLFKTKASAIAAAEKAKVGDVDFVTYPVGNKFAVIPEKALQRWEQHTEAKDFSPAEAITRMYSTQWRRNVLALHPTWYTGNVIEAALRTALAGAGPASFYRGYKVPKTLKTLDPDAHRELGGRVYSGGHLAMQANLPREFHLNVSGSGTLAKAIRSMQAARKEKAPIKATIDAWEGFSDFTMGTLSGGIEGFFQRGMLGKALSKDPIMDGHMIKVSKAAIEDAAKGLTKTENQVKMGRIVDEMYGRYGKWSPGMRRAIANYTPFISWTMNALNFLYRTLPRDHPVLVALAASVQPYTEEWRKDKGLSKFVQGAVPGFLQGAVPSKEGFARYPTRYTPFAAAANFPEGIADLVLPQYSSAIEMMRNGTNWKGQKVKNPDGTPLDPLQKILASALYLYEGAVPFSQQVYGPAEKYEEGARTVSKLAKPKSFEEIKGAFDPFKKVAPPKKKVKKGKSLLDSVSTEQKSLLDSLGTTEQKSLLDR